MKELNKNCVYDLSELTSEEYRIVYEWLLKKDVKWKTISFKYFKNNNQGMNLKFFNDYWGMCAQKPTHNAKELFYTLENVQVDCRELSEEQIKEMADVFEKNGYDNSKIGLEVKDIYFLLRQRWGKDDRNFGILGDHKDGRFTTITYEKFMGLFVEQPKEEKPKHYSKGIDTFARMEANCTKEECLAFAKGNIDKYNWRNKGQDLEDYKKIVSYANWAIKLLKDEK